MLNIRTGVFETNSSSVHALIMCTKEEYEKVQNNKLLIGPWNDELITWEEAKRDLVKKSRFSDAQVEAMSEDDLRDLLQYYGIAVTVNDWHGDFEEFTYEYVSPHGDTIVAFGHSGYDG